MPRRRRRRSRALAPSSERSGWTVLGSCPSPIAGGDGNAEFLVAARKG